MSLEMLASQIGIHKNDLKQALTHYSFYQDKNESKANARLVFVGMYAFKGNVANVLYKYYSGSGTQLQHILGNLFKNVFLHRLFDQWQLGNKVRAAENFDVKNHKHIFVYAILGCVSQLPPEKQSQFIFKHIINDNTEHIFKHSTKNKDWVYQAKLLAKQELNKKLTTKMELSNNSLHIAIVQYDGGIELSRAQSKSYRYARKKAMKLALQILSKISLEKFVLETNYLERIKQRIEEEKQAYQQELEKKTEAKKIKRKENAEKAKRLRKAKDIARKKVQAAAKKRKQEQKALAAKKAKEAKKPMNAGKRRYLEDKKK